MLVSSTPLISLELGFFPLEFSFFPCILYGADVVFKQYEIISKVKGAKKFEVKTV